MHTVIGFFAALPGQIAGAAVYAYGHPVVLAVSAMTAATVTVAVYINLRSWRKGA